MNHKQFRPGNLVNVSGKPETITGILPFGMYFHLMYYPFNLSKIEPIPITEEWLIKFGFKQWGDKYTFGLKGINIHKRKRGFVLRKSVPIIKYVHQLQNLYFDLTGEELEINSTK